MSNTDAVRKPTKRDKFLALRALPDVLADDELVAFIDHELELLEKRSSVIRKPTAKQTENASYKADIVAWMEPGQVYACADIVKGVPSIVEAGLSTQRVNAMLTQLVSDGAIIRTIDKRKSSYSLAE